ncbi:DUF3052 domain-containing protein [Rothia sp. P7181]|uniref:DUF3052 domain-containing protein n=1 Tax=unclassified Rothia (in: high G+C Gram-positive bacteria) TaxID=2689056 RepID=UPI003AD1E9EE
MNETKTAAEQAVVQLGFKDGDLIQEFGYDDDVDFDLRDALMDHIGSDLLDEDDQDVVDGILVWWREERFGDLSLSDALVDTLVNLDEGGVVWLLTLKPGREGHLNPAEIRPLSGIAGLRPTSSVTVGPDWIATRLVARRH